MKKCQWSTNLFLKTMKYMFFNYRHVVCILYNVALLIHNQIGMIKNAQNTVKIVFVWQNIKFC